MTVLNPYLDLYRDLGRWRGALGEATPEFLSVRRKLVAAYSWAIPSTEALEAIAALDIPTLELGAGTGYWAFCLRQLRVDITAFDANPLAPPHWHPVEQGTPETLLPRADSPLHARALMLCWPPLNEPLADRALALYRGDTVIEIGEGPGGNTGTDAFHARLREEWRLVRELELPRWPGARDSLRIWSRP